VQEEGQEALGRLGEKEEVQEEEGEVSRMRRYLSAAALALGTVALLAPGASATYHENLISEVHEGFGVTGDYVELQSYAAGQNFVGGHYIVNYDGANNVYSTFQFPSNVTNGANQATILVAHDASTPGADFISTNLQVVNTNGATCFLDTTVPLKGLDCVDWGAPMGGPALPSPAGTPTLPGGFGNNTSISRNIIRGCATALDPADDTNNSIADFFLMTSSPRSNSVAPTEKPCATAVKKKCKKKKAKRKSGAYEAKKKKCKKKKKK
jgi:hypothetical protein